MGEIDAHLAHSLNKPAEAIESRVDLGGQLVEIVIGRTYRNPRSQMALTDSGQRAAYRIDPGLKSRRDQ
jgi:hypothetical protein